MGALKKRHTSLSDAISTLDESIEIINTLSNEKLYRTCRDSVIQRFEYSIDSFWKFLKMYLLEKQGLSEVTGSPREVLRVSHENNLSTQDEFAVMTECIASRNLSSHTYQEEVAEAILKKAPRCCAVMKEIASRCTV